MSGMTLGPVHQPERAIVGHCPACLRVVMIENNHEVWPPIRCECGWHGDTTELRNKRRFERGLDDVITGHGAPQRADMPELVRAGTDAKGGLWRYRLWWSDGSGSESGFLYESEHEALVAAHRAVTRALDEWNARSAYMGSHEPELVQGWSR
jgi:hypothetical protein